MAKCNIKNRTIFCKDNLDILQGINTNSIDLIYLDPPFNTNKNWTSPIDSSAKGAGFKDIFREEDVKDEWVLTIKEDNEKLYNFLTGIKNIEGKKSYNYCYLCYMAIRIVEMQRVLKDTGSLYLHCDPTMSHYLKIVLDCIFGEKNFRNEIVWSYQGTGEPKKNFKKKHDIIFFYSKSLNNFFSDIGSSVSISDFSKSKFTKEDKKGKFKEIKHPDGSIHKQYIRENQRRRAVWEIPIINAMAKERIGYPTQKPLALLDIIIKASSKEGDIVLDPFCGCATTCVAAEKLGRDWIGIDVSIKAYDLVKERLKKEVYPNLFDAGILTFSTEPLTRTDKESDALDKKWVYVISNESYKDEFKVGVASNWEQRLNSYQTSDPNRAYKMEYKIHTPFFRKIEGYIHKKFENRHEWVRAKLKDIVEKIESYEKELDNELF